jgi:hypothetical protein
MTLLVRCVNLSNGKINIEKYFLGFLDEIDLNGIIDDFVSQNVRRNF